MQSPTASNMLLISILLPRKAPLGGGINPAPVCTGVRKVIKCQQCKKSQSGSPLGRPVETCSCCRTATSGTVGRQGGREGNVRDRLQVRWVSDLPPGGWGDPRPGGDLEHRGRRQGLHQLEGG